MLGFVGGSKGFVNCSINGESLENEYIILSSKAAHYIKILKKILLKKG